MSINNQRQTSGEGSTLVQANTINMVGIDEKRVREVFNEMIPIALQNYTQESHEIAKERVNKFEDELLTKMIKTSTLEALKEPAIQIQLIEAQKIACSTEEVQDYEMLSELMVKRFQVDDDRNEITAISKAIQAVDKVSKKSLQGLTLFFAVMTYNPIDGNLEQRLSILEDLYKSIIDSELPSGELWVENLELNDALKVSTFTSLHQYESMMYNYFEGYLKNGILIGSENYRLACEKLLQIGLNETVLELNPNNNNYMRLPFINKAELQKMTLTRNFVVTKATADEIKITEEIFDLYDGTGMSIEEFTGILDRYSHIKIIKTWWNTNIANKMIQLTSVGKMLAETNCLRLKSDLPKLNFKE